MVRLDTGATSLYLAGSGARCGSGSASGGEVENLGWGVRVVVAGDEHGGGGFRGKAVAAANRRRR
jgi:hypothetical protein